MSTNRRDFLQMSLAAGALLATRAAAQSKSAGEKPAPKSGGKKILILGGTQFLGPAVVGAAIARGHTVTLFNRGKTHPTLFPDIEKLHGDRDPKKGEALFKVQACVACHTTADGQTPKGPHLVDIGKRYSAAELVESILKLTTMIGRCNMEGAAGGPGGGLGVLNYALRLSRRNSRLEICLSLE